MNFKLRSSELEHLPKVKFDGIEVEAAQWKGIGSRLPHWCSYQTDPQSLPGKLLIISPDGEGIAKLGDMIVLCENGLLAVDPDDFFKVYKEDLKFLTDQQPKKPLPQTLEMEHEESPNCWCCPEIFYLDLLSDECLYLHSTKEDAH